jgi:polysaccharide biosynthesis protein PelA
VHMTDYAHKVLDWRSFAVARSVKSEGATAQSNDWIVRGDGEVRELHWPLTTSPDLAASRGVTGYAAGPDGTYIHISDGAARVSFDAPGQSGTNAKANGLPYIAEANGFVRNFKREPNGMSFEFGSYYQPFVKLANAQTCSASVAGKPVTMHREGAFARFETPALNALDATYQPVEIRCDR